jgi:hypothetical protein
MKIFNSAYLNLINEGNTKFKNVDCILLPSKYIPVDSIKQCIISNHLMRQLNNRDNKFFNYLNSYSEIEHFIFKNLNLALTEIFKNKKYLKLIEDNEFQQNPIEFLISTNQFGLNKNIHLIISVKVNSNSDTNGNNKFYVLFVTSYLKNEIEFKKFKQQNFKSLNHSNQIPIQIIGESKFI